MALQILLNFLIAVIWMFLNNNWSASGLIVGYMIGLALIGLFGRFWPQGFYMRKVWAMIKLLALFIKELFKSSFVVIGQVLSPKLNIRPGIFAYKTELTGDWEVTILANLITLTPGTLTLDVSREGSTLYIHAMDIDDVDKLCSDIRSTFEKAILEVTR
ncbi:Na+/H+ antiporter subunit E [Paenibacillus woosongensis]|uniref:Na(+)/H(+) antiporter subunit E n=1 Tax=Paenibacillus woosongensis TaxID=307580 RepID=A0ABQ4MVE5_9BACL|nr:Na+/H+ antiporter subunit E [Paenibacillus woosongensis]GIP59895.1 Na(+)/H(+) antiporter subunit E [Paenibacillus woosongensis]